MAKTCAQIPDLCPSPRMGRHCAWPEGPLLSSVIPTFSVTLREGFLSRLHRQGNWGSQRLNHLPWVPWSWNSKRGTVTGQSFRGKDARRSVLPHFLWACLVLWPAPGSLSLVSDALVPKRAFPRPTNPITCVLTCEEGKLVPFSRETEAPSREVTGPRSQSH